MTLKRETRALSRAIADGLPANSPTALPTVPALGGVLRLRKVLDLYPVSASTWWAGVRSGRYPQPIRLGARAVGWRTADVLALIENAEASR